MSDDWVRKSAAKPHEINDLAGTLVELRPDRPPHRRQPTGGVAEPS